jgi:ATP adenylyltransferase
MAEGARFAWIIDESAPHSDAASDREILRTRRFVAVPSVGALVPGWTLVVPRRPLRNLSAASHVERRELLDIVDEIARPLRRQGEEVYCFEHGSRAEGSLTGCGVDQAHLHIVPLGFDLIAAAARSADGAIKWADRRIAPSPFDALPQQGEYVVIWRTSDRLTMIGSVQYPVSQWVRRLIAAELGIGSEWNYQTHPQAHNVARTLSMLAGLRTSLSL